MERPSLELGFSAFGRPQHNALRTRKPQEQTYLLEGEIEWDQEGTTSQQLSRNITMKWDQDNQCAQNDTKSQQLSRNITRNEWVISIKKYNEGTTKKPQIERVPSMLRGIKSNRKCFYPLRVSIGPYHRKKKKLQAFETLKPKYAQQFVHDCGDQVSIEQLVAEVEKVVKNARECYEEGSTEEYDDESFMRMMFLDGCFVLHFMCMFTKAAVKGTKTTPAGTTAQDMKASDAYFVCRDLFLLDNQIPSLILKVLITFRVSEEMNLIQCFLDELYRMPPEETSWLNGIKKDSYPNGDKLNLDGRHLLDLMRKHLIGPEANSHQDRVKVDSSSEPDSHQHHVKVDSSSETNSHQHRVREDSSSEPDSHQHRVREDSSSEPDSHQHRVKEDHWYSFRSVTELESAGINFKASGTYHVTDVVFKSRRIYGGTLKLPPIVVDDSTKPLLLNLVAYEMSPNGPKDMSISSYICLMDSLIDHANDVKELRKQGILLNRLGSDEQLAQLFNEIANGVVDRTSAYANIKCEIEKQWKNETQVWIAEWMHNHFSSPWTVLAFLGALLVLALTVVQTYFAVNPRD